MDYPLRPKCPTCDWERLVVPCADLFHGEAAVLVPAPQPEIMEHAVKPTMSAAEVLAHPQPFPPLVPAPPEPQQGYWEDLIAAAFYEGFGAACLEAMSDAPKSPRESWGESRAKARQVLRAVAARSPTPEWEAIECEVIQRACDHWFIQGGEAQFGPLSACLNTDELIASILRVVRQVIPPTLDTCSPTPAAQAWQQAALLKDRTRLAIRERVAAGESVQAVADDYAVPEAFVEAICAWQLFWDQSNAVGSPAPAKEP